MSDRRCPFYEVVSSGVFSYKDRCRRNGREVTMSTYNTYCNNWESGYTRCPNYKPIDSDNNSSCFLTSACVEAMGLYDCCDELTALRAFRDEWLVNQPGGKEEIEEYYRIAPQIVEKIHALPDCQVVLKKLYDELVVPCVEFITFRKHEEAWELYKKITLELKEKYNAK